MASVKKAVVPIIIYGSIEVTYDPDLQEAEVVSFSLSEWDEGSFDAEIIESRSRALGFSVRVSDTMADAIRDACERELLKIVG